MDDRFAPCDSDDLIEHFWTEVARGWDIEPRAYFEKEAVPMGFRSPVEMAVHWMWKRRVHEDYLAAALSSPSVAESPTPKERHLMDVYDSLGVKWGDDPFEAIHRLKAAAESPTLETHHEALRLIEKLVERDCMNWQMCGHQTCQEVRRLLLPSAPSPSAAAQQETP